MDQKISALWKEIKQIIKRSPVPEDYVHAKNTLYWLLKLQPKADRSMRLAAFAHDIERAIPHKKVKRENFIDFDSFKIAHAKNSAEIIADIMKKYGIPKKDIDDVKYLVLKHETGGCKRADLIKDADSLSFFDVNLAFYAKRNEPEEVINRCIWGYKRLSPERRPLLYEIIKKKDIPAFVRKILSNE